LGLKTSFVLANFWLPKGIGAFNPRIEFSCHRCGARLTYHYVAVALFTALILLPMILLFGLMPFGVGYWSYVLLTVLVIAWWCGLAVFFSYFARPFVADPPLEGDF